MTDIAHNPQPTNRIDVTRRNDRTLVHVNGVLACGRDEATGAIAWNPRATEQEKEILRREVWNKIPWVPRVGPRNRAERRRFEHHAKKR